MGIRKLDLEKLSKISFSQPSLSKFWKIYYSNISKDLNSLFFSELKENIQITFLQKDVVTIGDYFSNTSGDDYLAMFKILNSDNICFINIPNSLSNSIICGFLGGKIEGKFSRKLSNTDNIVLNSMALEIMDIVLTPLGHNISSSQVSDELNLFRYKSLNSDQLVTILQFAVNFGDFYYTLEFGLSNKTLDSVSLV